MQKQYSETSRECAELRGKYQELQRHALSLEDSRALMMQQLDGLNVALREVFFVEEFRFFYLNEALMSITCRDGSARCSWSTGSRPAASA